MCGPTACALQKDLMQIRALREQLSLRVQQNVFYVHYNEKLYRSYFG